MLTNSRLTIDLRRLRANYRRILHELDGKAAAGMVKADGYGLGAGEVSSALWSEGCRQFFVAQVSEGLELRKQLPEATIHVLNGVVAGTERELSTHRLTPVLNSLHQIDLWRSHAETLSQRLAATLHVDTGMSRLGLAEDEWQTAVNDPRRFEGIHVQHIMSHLASADELDSPQSAQQLSLFRSIRAVFPAATASLANSAGIFLGPEYHFDLARPGIALYGGSPLPARPNPMQHVVTLEAPVVQIRNAAAGETIGYGATHTMTAPGRIATIAVGYADGFLRSTASNGSATIAGQRIPIVGRVSMDLITLDITAVDPGLVYPGAAVELIGEHRPIDDVARDANTIANEILTDLGRRYDVIYRDKGRLGP